MKRGQRNEDEGEERKILRCQKTLKDFRTIVLAL